ncbi:radial spoke head protein 4 homolog A-like [Clytia hemisphaerica]|uniref:Uncharacterized protein n=1 Tax=Clytia hemisphaerica TaxID=252671 RepID=A0A7M5X8N2_9CNID|eukprot:TCONS_00054303-protein
MMEVANKQKEDDPSNSIEDYICNAKTFLLRSDGKSGVTMYDHLVSILSKMIEKEPENAAELLKEFSRKEHKARFIPEKDTIEERIETTNKVNLANDQKNLFNRKDIEVPNTVGDNEAEEEERLILADVMENAFYFEQAGIGLGREEVFRVFLALKQLTDCYQLKSCRFWGKILGSQANYIIAEVEFRDGEDPHKENEDPDNLSSSRISEANEPIEDEVDDIPKPDYKPPVTIPQEDYGEGCNSKIYYVCNDAGLSWHRLPPVTPQQIHVARQIKKFCTGDLEAPIISYPPFPGTEIHYLRAMIARISAATHISPQGYYIFEEDEDEEIDETARKTFIPNIEFEGIPVSDLCDATNTFWVHHNPYILPQGRTTWFNPLQKNDEEEIEEEEDEEEDREEPDDIEPEEGPPLLTPLSEDLEINSQTAWTANKSTGLVSQYAIAVMHSNLWPGAHAFAVDKKFDNIYIGYGLKYSSENYSPPAPPAAQEEYPSGPEVTEAEDPTVEQERALAAAQQEAMENEDEDEESEDYDEED